MSDEEREKILEKVRHFLSDDEPVDWQRLKEGLPSQGEWLETNEEIEATLHRMLAGDVEASETTVKEIKAKYDAALEKEILKGLESGPSIPVTPEYWQKFRAQCVERLKQKKESMKGEQGAES